MKMGSRRRSGGILHRHIESCKHKFSTVDEIVAYLRSHFPEYSRHKLLPFTRAVQHSLESMKSKNVKSRCRGLPSTSSLVTGDVEDDGADDHRSARKKMKTVDVSEERLLRLENQQIRKKPNSIDKCTSSWSVSKIDFLGGDGGSGKSDEKYFSDCGGGGGAEKLNGKDVPSFKDLGGIGVIVKQLKRDVILPFYRPHLPRWFGVMPVMGILLHGPPGCGKTKLAHAIANESGVPFYKISATELVSSVSGGSEENIRDLFGKASRTAPSIVFIDEIDAIASKRENLQREMDRRMVTQLLTCMDEAHRVVQSVADPNAESSKIKLKHVLVIGATNRPDAIDPALRRPGRFDREIVLGVPDENARVEILSLLSRDLRVEGDLDLIKLAMSTEGFVGADLTDLVNRAGNLAMNRFIDSRMYDLSVELTDEEHTEDLWKLPWLPEEMQNIGITMADFEGSGVALETGFLLYGPPGCGKTLIAKAVANEAGANFIHIKGPELLNKYVGESESAVRTIFSRARTCSPCILFFDEVDALTTERGKEGAWVVERFVTQLLMELDGADPRQGVYVIGATNRPEVVDRALLRPGRFEKRLFVPLPSPDERGLILKAIARNKPIDASVDLVSIGRDDACENLSGADLKALMNEAAMAALEEKLTAQTKTVLPTLVRKLLRDVRLEDSDQKYFCFVYL